MNRLGVIRISKCAPRVTVTMQWDCEGQPLGAIALYMRRVGEPMEFAAYPPIQVTGGQMLFQFDDLLFSKEPGRYEGRLKVAGQEYATIHFEYYNSYKLVSAENVSA